MPVHLRDLLSVLVSTGMRLSNTSGYFSGALKLPVLDDIDQNAINWWETTELYLCLGGRFVGTSVFGFLFGEALCNTCIL